jgi:demethylspheroidene O-methyltransferase
VRHWRDWRNDLLASPRFQAFAARFPLTRGITSRRAQQVFDLVAGFVYSQILHACVELNLFEHLRVGPRKLADLQRLTGLPEEGALRLLRAASALGLLEKRDGDCYGLGPHGAALLGNAGALSMVRHHKLLYADLVDPVAMLKGEGGPTSLSRFWAYARNGAREGVSDSEVASYSELMTQSQTLVRRDVLDTISLAGVRRLVDIGGGEGAFAAEAAQRWPELGVVTFDLPPVAARAQARFEQLELSGRAKGIGGNFHSDPLPEGADAMSLVRVLHDHDDGAAQSLLNRIARFLPSGGRLIVAEPMAGIAGSEAMGEAYFGFYLMAMGSGRPRGADEIEAMLQKAGFRQVRRLRTPRPMLASVIEAIR